MWENNEYKMCMREESILDYERVMLSSGECNYLIPMLFIGEKDKLTAYYDCRGFVPLSRYKIEKTTDALYIMEKVLLIMSNVIEYLITPSKILLTTDTVFYDTESEKIKIAYVPADDNQDSLRRNLINIIAQLKAEICDGQGEYLDRLANLVYANNYTLRDLVNKLGLLRRELYSETSASS
ncbi:MAG: DUF6382 domain-containing protein [Eubacteriales bacterium]|nr:DUF6382 domain-containing protein [Eubacteriales bacterium]